MRRSITPPATPRSVGALLARWRDGERARSRAAEVEALRAAWERIVGALHADGSGVTGLEAGTLRVAAATETGARELAWLSDHIVSASNLALGRPAVQRVVVQVGELPERRPGGALPPGDVPPWEPRRRPLATGEREECQRVASVIADGDLRAVFESWMERHLAAGPERPRGHQDNGQDVSASHRTP